MSLYDPKMVPLIFPLVFITASAVMASYSKRKKEEEQEENDSCHGGIPKSVIITLPQWAIDEFPTYCAKTYKTDEDKMALAIELSARNVKEDTGGPFGCAIFENNSITGISKLVSIGCNRVVSLQNSTLHGETVAIQMAQAKLKTFTLSCIPIEESSSSSEGGDGSIIPLIGKKTFELFTSCEPCAMCLGASLWSGVRRMVCGATKDDAQAIGFDEGPVFPQSYTYLEKSGMQVKRNVLREEAAKVLEDYGKNGVIYNGTD